MMTIKKSHMLKLDIGGRFAINVVDNLIIVHHQASKVYIVQYKIEFIILDIKKSR